MNKMLLTGAMLAAGLGYLALADGGNVITITEPHPLPAEAKPTKRKRKQETVVRLDDVRPTPRQRSHSLDRLLRMKARA